MDKDKRDPNSWVTFAGFATGLLGGIIYFLMKGVI